MPRSFSARSPPCAAFVNEERTIIGNLEIECGARLQIQHPGYGFRDLYGVIRQHCRCHRPKMDSWGDSSRADSLIPGDGLIGPCLNPGWHWAAPPASTMRDDALD